MVLTFSLGRRWRCTSRWGGRWTSGSSTPCSASSSTPTPHLYQVPNQTNSVLYATICYILSKKKDTDRREGKDRLFRGQNFSQFIAALANLHQDDLKKGMNSSYSSYRPSAIHPILHIVLVQNSYRTSTAKKFIESVPQAAAPTFAFSSVFILLLLLFYCSVPWQDLLDWPATWERSTVTGPRSGSGIAQQLTDWPAT